MRDIQQWLVAAVLALCALAVSYSLLGSWLTELVTGAFASVK